MDKSDVKVLENYFFDHQLDIDFVEQFGRKYKKLANNINHDSRLTFSRFHLTMIENSFPGIIPFFKQVGVNIESELNKRDRSKRINLMLQVSDDDWQCWIEDLRCSPPQAREMLAKHLLNMHGWGIQMRSKASLCRQFLQVAESFKRKPGRFADIIETCYKTFYVCCNDLPRKKVEKQELATYFENLPDRFTMVEKMGEILRKKLPTQNLREMKDFDIIHHHVLLENVVPENKVKGKKVKL